MDRPKMLSGEELVLRGVTKLDATLPEIGMKDVLPNGSWLEQKHIQAALEARKHLVEVERIEKCGTLSHAEWREDLMLAEVTQQTGGYWQYLGHHIGKKLYLKPEEALFLVEVNCLLLKHNEVTVSLQKAYSLLLDTTVSLIQYKVYASLSRLGYKVYRHQKFKGESKEHTPTTAIIQNKTISDSNVENNVNIEVQEINVDDNEANAIKHKREPTIININDTEKKKCFEINDNKITDNVVTVNMEIEEPIIKEKHVNVCNEENDEHKSLIVVDNLDLSIKNTNQIESKDDSHTLNEVSEKYYNKIEIEDVTYQDGNDINNVKLIEDTEIQNNKTKCAKNINICTRDTIVDSLALQAEPQINYGVLIEDNKTVSNEDNEVAVPMEVDNSNLEVDSGFNGDETIDRQENHVNTLKKMETFESQTGNTKSDDLNHDWNSVAMKLKKLQHRKLKHTNATSLHEGLASIPELFQKQIVTVQVPEEQYIPRNIFVNNTAYVINLETVSRKPITPTTVDSANYSTDEVNESHIRRLRSSSRSETPQNSQIPQLFSHMRFTRPNSQFRPYNFWRPRNSSNYFHFNMFFQRPLHTYFLPRFHYQARTSPFWRPFTNPNNFNSHNSRIDTTSNVRKRARDAKLYHLQAIKTLAARLKLLVLSGNTQVQNIQSLQRLIQTYNSKYMCRLRLTEDFDIIDDVTIVDTIELEDEEESKSKKPRFDGDAFNENLNNLRQLALKLKDLEAKDIAFARHRRALSNAIKTFNKSFNADVYLNLNYDVIDRRHITLDSSSDSDCVAKGNQTPHKRKKLRNPFNILKRLSAKSNVEKPSTSGNNENGNRYSDEAEENQCYPSQMSFDKNWLPSDDDFGRREVVPKLLMHGRLMDTYRDDFLYEFLNNDSMKYENWLDVKIAFFKYIEDTNESLKNERTNESSEIGSQLNSLIGPQDCTDMPSVLKKLRIIKSNNEIDTETNLCVDFDVYNRDVQNFRKSNRPKAHFRVVCIDESSNFPSAAEVYTLHSSYDDNVCIVFAIVGGSSISYLQINPTNLPVYIPSNDIP